jgi:expansin (peptidoglycan-binding protein)
METPTSSTPETPATSSSPTPETAEAPAQKADTSAAGSKRGEATFYGGNTNGGMCSFSGYTLPSGMFGTALSDSNWDNSAACGQCVSVTGPSGKKITAMVTDQCPGCGPNHLDLYENAFEQLAEKQKGIINVSWDFVPCGISGPIVLKNKEGTSPYWFSIQVMNANVGVSKVEVSIGGGASWKAMARKEYNFFENPAGFGKDTMDVKVTGVSGKSVVVKGVTVTPSALKTASANL